MRREGLKTTGLYHGHACFPKSEPINGADLDQAPFKRHEQVEPHTTRVRRREHRDKRDTYKDKCEIEKKKKYVWDEIVQQTRQICPVVRRPVSRERPTRVLALM